MLFLAGALLSSLQGCSSDNAGPASNGTGGTPNPGADAASPDDVNSTTGLRAFLPPIDPGPGGILFAASGELLALTGYAFPPASPNDLAFVDGWEVKFSRLLVTIDNLTLSDNPDLMPGDESKTGGAVAQLAGPWAVDLARSDPTYLPGKGSPGEQAVPIAAVSKTKSGAALSTDGTRYAFGFDLGLATPTAYNVNLDTGASADYREMVSAGCAVLYAGTATFKASGSTFTGCDVHPDWPKVVDFRFCFKDPATYVNCQNPDNQGEAFPDEEAQRGIALKTNQSVIAQVTVHTDHPFWDSVLHDAPLHFDQYAARVVGQEAGTPLATLDITQGVDHTDYTDALGNHLQWRYCVEPPTDVHPELTGPMSFDTQSVPHAVNGNPSTGLRDFYDFATYNASTEGHLNSDGLCFVKRNYPSPY